MIKPRERRYSKYKAHDVWGAMYEQQNQLEIEILHDTVSGNCIMLRRSGGSPCKAVVLARSSDWYKYSLNCVKTWRHGIEIVVCGTHDSCLPVPVLAIDQVKWYEPEVMRIESLEPLSFEEDKKGNPIVNDAFDKFRRSKYGHNMLIGALMCGRADAIKRLAYMRESTRYRYEAKLKKLHQRRSGQPIEV